MNDPKAVVSKTIVPSPVGGMQVFVAEGGVRAIVFEDSDPERNGVRGAVLTGRDVPVADREIHERVAAQLQEYFAGARTAFDLPLAPVGTEFQQLAWRALQQIPFGETRSYAEQAAAIGRPSAVRAIGAANGRNPLTIVVPCHRVIGSGGSLTGFAGGLDRKRVLLQHEGVLPRDASLPFAN